MRRLSEVFSSNGARSAYKWAAAAVVLALLLFAFPAVRETILGAGLERGSPAEGRVVLKGVILQTSEIPDPETSLYKDCLYLTKVEVREVLEGARFSGNVLVALWAFKDRVLQPTSTYRPGGSVLLELVPFCRADPSIRRIQEVDDINEFDLEVYWAEKAETLVVLPLATPAGAGAGPPPSSSVSPRARAPSAAAASAADESARRLRAMSIKADRDAIAGTLARHGGSWEDWFSELAPLRDGLREKLRASGRFLLKGKDYFSNLPYLEFQPISEDGWPDKPVRMLTHLKDELRRWGMDLIVVPFPPKEEITASTFSGKVPPDNIIQPYKLKLHQALLEADVEVVDLTPDLLRERQKHPYVYYDCEDPHPADGAIQVAARVIARRLERYGFADDPGVPKGICVMRRCSFSVPEGFSFFARGARYVGSQVLTLRGKPWPHYPRTSPILLIGDSFIGVPGAYGLPNADLQAHITKETGIIPFKLEQGGGGASMMRTLARQGRTYLENRRVCVFSFYSLFLFVPRGKESDRLYDWQVVDLPRPENETRVRRERGN